MTVHLMSHFQMMSSHSAIFQEDLRKGGSLIYVLTFTFEGHSNEAS